MEVGLREAREEKGAQDHQVRKVYFLAPGVVVAEEDICPMEGLVGTGPYSSECH
jgi:hypothetical protein